MPRVPSEVTESLKNDKALVAEVTRLVGPKTGIIHGWLGEDIVFIVAKDYQGIYFLSLTLMEENKYRGYIDNISYL